MDREFWLRQPRLIAAVVCFALGIIVAGVGFISHWSQPQPVGFTSGLGEPSDLFADVVPLDAPIEALETTEPAELVIYISGAVLRPDVYRLPAEARIKDVVMAAGGFTPDAATEAINLAQPILDAEHIHVPYQQDGQASRADPGETMHTAGGTQLIDLNQATSAELETLSGVGPVLAQRIVGRRTEQGPYTAVEQLRDVPGIGDKLFGQLEPLVTVGR
ncbi:ComEA family DNA-binding protein [Candidatus Chloroploca sp. Khr17]|uniref:ComEA family DNA-binding protein n=1 Tax=Candidatus Chloroploca sp. Khr17 TaxID=2496869 RepID=UPI00101D68FE|nr:ComEA family DNA-binding protein [Candidatus Chloroploca sp. Khr17]